MVKKKNEVATSALTADDAWAKSTSTKYGKLAGKVDYDHEAVDQLADALNEIAELEIKVNQLKQLVDENKELHQFVWRTQGNLAMAIHNIGNEHLANIMLHLLRTNRSIPRGIRGEAITRGLVIPAVVPVDWRDGEDAEWEAARRMIFSDRKDVV